MFERAKTRRCEGSIGLVVLYVGLGLVCVTGAQERPSTMTEPQHPVRIFGNTYYVGSRGLSAVLIASSTGAVLIDGALQESASDIAANIKAIGVPLEDVKLILNSHVHSDHAGGIAELQRRTGASVAALSWSATALREGRKQRGDPQFATSTPPADRVANVQTIRDGETLRVGSVTLTAHHTGGHTPGGTSWTWRSCEGERCEDFVYADSLTSVSADGFRFTDDPTYPEVLTDFKRSFAFLRTVSCGILLTPHPEFSDFWTRVARRDGGERDALIDSGQCARYADRAEAQLRARLDMERQR